MANGGNPSRTCDAVPPRVKSTTATDGYEMGQSFSVGYWSYICHGAFWTPVLGTDHANGEFVVVEITAENVDTSASTLPPFKLKDVQGRTYDESSTATFNKGFFSVLERLNPGISKRGYIAFDVPANRNYDLLVSGGIQSGKQATVALHIITLH